MDNIFISLIIIFIGTFLIQLLIPNLIMINSIFDLKITYGKIYISLIVAILVALIQLFIYNIYNPFNKLFYIPFIIIIIILIYLYRFQVYIDDSEYLKEMIEYNSMSILVSNNISKKTANKEVKRIANDIINEKQTEINLMKKIISENKI